MDTPSLREAFLYWLKLGFTSFGGPGGQIALMHQDLVHDKKWISEDRFSHALNFCILLPGPEAQQLAIYMGWLLHKTIGGLIAGLLFILPAFFILSCLAYVYMRYGEIAAIQGFFNGVKPAIVALVLFAAFRMGSKTLKNQWLSSIATGAFFLVLFLNASFPLVLIIAGLIGLFANKFFPASFQRGAKKSEIQSRYFTETLSENQKHVQANWTQSLKTLLIGCGVIIGSLTTLILALGLDHFLVKTAWFYTKAAFLTFGGAYAVIPYIFQGAVDHYQWITSQQMLDALALGESTPGPLIMVITFISFVSGWSQIALPTLTPLHSGLIVATIATIFTFLPSFLMIFLGAPLIEKTRNQSKLLAPLNAITAAVIGLIFNLGITLANNTFWQPESWGIDWMSLAIAISAFIALQKYQVSTLLVILLSGLLGIVSSSGPLTLV
jgi:chromate transporter